jgi:hypothetical protein
MQSQLEAATRPVPAAPAAGRAPNAVEQRVLELIEESKSHAIPSEVIMPLYRQLESIPIEFLISTWHGSLFNGQPTEGWFGKNMISADHVQPLLFQRPDGSVYSNEVWGLAKLIEEEVYGLPTTVTLVYYDKPLKDYFRRVTNETVIGLTPGEMVGGPDFFFQLTRDHKTKIAP